MQYVEVHPSGDGVQIRFIPPRDEEPFVSNPDLVGGVLVHMGITPGPFEIVSRDGATFHRAVIL